MKWYKNRTLATTGLALFARCLPNDGKLRMAQ